MLKILQARLQQDVNRELLGVQAGFRKCWTRGLIASILWHRKKKGIPKKICFIDYTKAFVWITTNILWNILKRWEYQTILPASWETYMQDKKEYLELYMEQRPGSKLGKQYVKAVYCHAYLTYRQSTYKMLGWMTTSWGQDCPEKYQQLQICRWYHCNGTKWRTKEPFDEGEGGKWKSWLKTQQ